MHINCYSGILLFTLDFPLINAGDTSGKFKAGGGGKAVIEIIC
jgi:hypothetical protein